MQLHLCPAPPQAFGQACSTQRKVAADGETNEETLLQESATKEAYYMGRLLQLQSELKQSKAVVSCTQAHNEHLSSLLQELREVQYRACSLDCTDLYALRVRSFQFKSFLIPFSRVMRCWSCSTAG